MSEHYDNSATINVQLISIHAPLAGRDLHGLRLLLDRDISIHAPHAGRDFQAFLNVQALKRFQSTHPSRGATLALTAQSVYQPEFQSTPPSRGATRSGLRYPEHGAISIHAPRAGRNYYCHSYAAWEKDFNPRAPCGARRFENDMSKTTEEFQSTRPVRGATYTRNQIINKSEISIHAPRAGRDGEQHEELRLRDAISIHAPRAGRDHDRPDGLPRKGDFNPRAPCGARPGHNFNLLDVVWISIHAPRAGRDRDPASGTSALPTFQSTRPVRGATR